MKFYLSSYKFGNEINLLKTMLPPSSRIGHINNSRDFTTANLEEKFKHQKEEMNKLQDLGFNTEALDLQSYFGKESALRKKLSELNGIWVSGGNAFVLRQAMKLSGFDIIFNELKTEKHFLYGGYSAGVCVLCDSLKYIQHVDNPKEFPYEENQEIIWEGLNVFSYGILPHYKSEHSESSAIEEEIAICIQNKWLFKALSDGEVLIINEE